MKKNILLIAFIVTIVLIGFNACTRDLTLKSEVSTTDGSSFLRIINVSPNFRSIYNQQDTFSILINGNKVSGNTPGAAAILTYGSSFPAINTLNGYFAVAPGSQAIKFTVSGVITPDSIPIATFTKTFVANQAYTFFITDSIKSTSDAAQIFVADTYTKPDLGFYSVRFVHAVLNDTAGKSIDIYSARNAKNIFTGLKPSAVTTYSSYPFNALLSDTLYVRRSGTLINLATLNGQIFANQRTYTLYYRGDGNLTTGTKGRALATYIH